MLAMCVYTYVALYANINITICDILHVCIGLDAYLFVFLCVWIIYMTCVCVCVCACLCDFVLAGVLIQGYAHGNSPNRVFIGFIDRL